jgi:predicted MPP superfamily phosphohydrolase
MYVSRGLGTSVVPARSGAVPEIAHFEWALAAP